jgi:hypothetical protein
VVVVVNLSRMVTLSVGAVVIGVRWLVATTAGTLAVVFGVTDVVFVVEVNVVEDTDVVEVVVVRVLVGVVDVGVYVDVVNVVRVDVLELELVLVLVLVLVVHGVVAGGNARHDDTSALEPCTATFAARQ